MRLLSIGLLCVLTLATACGTMKTPEQNLLHHTTHKVILPSLAEFSASTLQLLTGAENFCRQPETSQREERFSQLQQHWRESMSAWQAAKVIPFGPISIDNQSWKIQFWPDKHNLVRRKLEELLNSQDELNVDRIARASVLTQGLTALEYLLFDEQGGQLSRYQNNAEGQRQCQLLVAVSQHTHWVAENLYLAWHPKRGNYAATLTTPGQQNLSFPDSNSAIAALVDSLVTATEAAKDGQLARPLGYKTKGDRPRPYMSEAWRSRYSTQSVTANLLATRKLYDGGRGFGMDDYLLLRDQGALADKISHQFGEVLNGLASAPEISQAVTDEQQRAAIEQTYQHLGKLVVTLKNELPPAMGVQLGFNANDGD